MGRVASECETGGEVTTGRGAWIKAPRHSARPAGAGRSRRPVL